MNILTRKGTSKGSENQTHTIFKYFPLTQDNKKNKIRHNTVEIKQPLFRITKTVRSEIKLQVQWKAGYVLQREQIIIPKSLQFWMLGK